MVVNFRARGISRDARKLVRTLTLIIIIIKIDIKETEHFTCFLFKWHKNKSNSTLYGSKPSMYCIMLTAINLVLEGFNITRHPLSSIYSTTTNISHSASTRLSNFTSHSGILLLCTLVSSTLELHWFDPSFNGSFILRGL